MVLQLIFQGLEGNSFTGYVLQCRLKKLKSKLKLKLKNTFMGLSTSPPQRDRNEMRKGLHMGFRLFFTTCITRVLMSHRALTACRQTTELLL